MDSERTRNLKDLRQKRLQYFDKLQTQSFSQATNSQSTGSPNRQKSTNKQTQQSSRSILAWDSPESSPKTSPSLRKKQQNGAQFRSMQNSTPFQSQIGKSKQFGSSPARKNESYLSPVRRSLSHAQTFSTTHQQNELNGDQFSYSYKDFTPVNKDRFFSTKPVEDVSWPPHTTGNYHRKESNISTNRKLLSAQSSRQVHHKSSTKVPNKSSIKVDDISFDADYVENILQEMGAVRKLKSHVHNELMSNFHDGKTPLTKYSHLSTKYGNGASHSATIYGYDDTKEGHDVDSNLMNTSRTFVVSKQVDDRNLDELNLSSDQNPQDQVKMSEQTENIKLTNVRVNSNEGKKEDNEEGLDEKVVDEEFNIGALQEAAKQGDDVLRKYIKRLSQRLHSKVKEEHTNGDYTCLKPSLERNPMEEQTSDYDRFETGLGSTSVKEYIGNEQSSRLEERLHRKESYNEYDGTDTLAKFHNNNEPHFVSKMNNDTDPLKDNIHKKEFVDVNYVNTQQTTDSNHVRENGDHVARKSDHMTNNQPKVAEPAVTSSELQELGLLDDTLNLESNVRPLADKEHKGDQISDPVMNLDQDMGEFQLHTHRPEQRPFSPLTNVHSLSEQSTNFELSYVHVPSPVDDADSFSDVDIEIYNNGTSDGSDKVNINKHPKPPEVAKKSTSSARRVLHKNSPSNTPNKPSYPKRAKTPERHITGVREHHEKERDAKKLVSPRREASPTRDLTDATSPGRVSGSQVVSVVNSSFLRGITPEPRAEQISIPSLDLHDDDDGGGGEHLEDQMCMFDDDMVGVDETSRCQEEDNETVLMQRIADFRPLSADANQIDGSGDAPDSNWQPQVSFDLPHQEAIDNLLGRSSDQNGAPDVRPSSAGPQRSTSGLLHKGRPSSAKSKVSQYMVGAQYKRKWATSSSLWGSRSISTGGDLEVAGQRSKLTNGVSNSPTLVRKSRPGSAKSVGGGDGDIVGSRVKGQKSRPWSAGYGRNRQELLKVGASQLEDGQVVKALDSSANSTIPPLTMQLIVDSPRTSEGISVWQLLPDEILLHIFSALNHYELVQCAQTCSFFNRIALDDSLWRHIQLEKSVLTDFGLTQIGERHPTHLGLIQCTGNITENGLRNLFRSCADSLKELNVSGCSSGELSGDSLLLHASRCYTLKTLDASWCSVTDNGLTAINDSVHQLSSLCLNGCREVSDQCLRAVIEKHGKSLSVLEVFGCFNLSTDSLRFIGDTCKHLRTLNIGQCYKLTDESIANLAPHIKGVRHLDLRGCKQIRDGCIRKIVRHCKKLESLVLANCTHIGNTALNEIATYLSNIRHIDLAGCKKVTNEGVKALATNCHQLTTLDISSTNIDHRSVTALASYCNKSLQGIKLNCCKEITEASIVKLLKHCKQLQTLHLYGVKRLHTLSVLKLQYPCLMYDEKSRASTRFRQSES